MVDRLDRDGHDPAALPFAFDVVLVTDLCVHADDVAAAVGVPAHRHTAATRVALAGYCFGVDHRLRALGLPALVLRYDGKERMIGEGPAAATVTADRWELLRVLAGRRRPGPDRCPRLDRRPGPVPFPPAGLRRASRRPDRALTGRRWFRPRIPLGVRLADVRLGSEFERFRVQTAEEQEALITRIVSG